MGIKEKQDKIIRISDLLVKIILSILLLLMIFEFYIFFSGNYNFNIFGISFNFEFVMNYLETIQGIQVLVCTILIVIIRVISKIYVDKLDLDYLKNYLYSVDKDAILYSGLEDEIIKGDLKTEGCIRHKNEYMIKLPKYKCTVKRYDEQELIGYRKRGRSGVDSNDRHHVSRFKFFNLDRIIEYTFEVLEKDYFYPLLYQVLKNKFSDISILDNKIIIKYHLYNNTIQELPPQKRYIRGRRYDYVVNTYNIDEEDDVIKIIEKVEFIYLEIIKQIGDENINGNDI